MSKTVMSGTVHEILDEDGMLSGLVEIRPLPKFSMWVVYFQARDVAAPYLARRWDVFAGVACPTPDLKKALTLEDIRAQIPAGLRRLERDANDNQVIVEMWL